MTGIIWLQIIMALMLFLPAWTVRFCEAWVFWLLFSVLSAVTSHFLKQIPLSLRVGSRLARPVSLVLLGDTLVAVVYYINVTPIS